MASYASLAESYETELHDGLIHAAHRALDTEAVISDCLHLSQNDVELGWG